MRKALVAVAAALFVSGSLAGCSASGPRPCSEGIISVITNSPAYAVDAATGGIPALIGDTLEANLPEPSCAFDGGPVALGEGSTEAGAVLVYVSTDSAELGRIQEHVAAAATEAGFTLATENNGVEGKSVNYILGDPGSLESQVIASLITATSQVENLGQSSGESVLIIQVVDFAD